MKRVLACLVVFCLGCVAVTGDSRTTDAEDSWGCTTCEDIPEGWRWDVDEDGQTDFVFSYSCYGAPEDTEPWGCDAMLIGFSGDAWEGPRREGRALVMNPVELGERIDSRVNSERWKPFAGLADLSCDKPDRWSGPFATSVGRTLAFKMLAQGTTIVGWARIQVDQCTGEITIWEVRLADERRGVYVGD